MDENLNKLPSSWVWTTVGQIGITVSGGTPSTNNPKFWGDEIAWITPADLSGYKGKYIANGKRSISKLGLENSSATLIPENALLFSSRAPIGYVAISQCPLTTSQGFKNLVPVGSTYIDYIYYYLQFAKEEAIKRARGTTFLELSGSAFSQIPVPLPPYNEQKRIVSKLEELFSRIEQSKVQLTAIIEQLQGFRKFILQYAFQGKLTEHWRSQQEDISTAKELIESINSYKSKIYAEHLQIGNADKTKLKIPSAVVSHANSTSRNNTAIPKDWVRIVLEDLSEKITDGTHFTPQYVDSGVPFISVKDIYNESVHFDNTKFIDRHTHEDLIKRCNPEPGDILLTKSGTIGRIAIVPSSPEFSLFVSVALIKNHKPLISSKYLKYALENYIASINIDHDIKGGIIKNFHLEDIRVANIPYCSKIEQDQLVFEIENKFSIVKELENTINKSLEHLNVVKQSFMKMAFEGRLIEQDQGDEPASILLDRMLEERKELLSQEKRKKSEDKSTLRMVKQMTEQLKNILDILNESSDPVPARTLWLSSTHKDDIDAFYAELKKHIDQGTVVEIDRKGKESLLKLSEVK